jgi:anti-sigma regulatory factor (Ser/Thr protein kinase)
MLTGVVEAIGLDSVDLNDISTAVTEACNNVVLHAYEGKEGPLDVQVYTAAGALEVVVRDRGVGIQPRIRLDEDSISGIGVPVIQALAHSVKFTGAPGQGTEVRMQFDVPLARPMVSIGEQLSDIALLMGERSPPAIELAVAPTPMARAVVPRVVSALAANANFSTDRICDAQLVADALVASSPAVIEGSHLGLGVSVEPHNLELHIGPLRTGRARILIVNSAVEGLGALIEKLTDNHRISVGNFSEALVLSFIDPR